MSQLPRPPTSNVAYYSAHRGPVWGSDGEFHHFARQCDPIHTMNGYWRFCTYEDDRRAYERGLNTPEAVLIAQDVSDGAYDDIMLRWVPGELDASNKPTVGTAAAHLEAIYNERRVLGKSLSFRGRVPLYPISTDQRLINYRLMRYGIQKGVLSDTNATSPSRHLIGHDTAQTSSTPVESDGRSQDRPPTSVTTSVSAHHRADEPSPHPSQTLHSEHAARLQGTPRTPRSRFQSAPPRVSSPFAGSTAIGASRPRRSQQQAQLKLTRIPPLNNPCGIPSLPATKPGGLREHNLADDDEDACYMHGRDETADELTDDNSTLSCANLTPSQLFDAQSATLPCLDCGVVRTHASHCWIDEATLSLRPIEELTASNYRELAEDAERFDPGPWTAHVGPPKELVLDDPKTQVQGMAKIIRNLDTSAEDPELQVFDDQSTVLLWALKSSGNVQIIEVRTPTPLYGESDQDECKIPDA